MSMRLPNGQGVFNPTGGLPPRSADELRASAGKRAADKTEPAAKKEPGGWKPKAAAEKRRPGAAIQALVVGTILFGRVGEAMNRGRSGQ